MWNCQPMKCISNRMTDSGNGGFTLLEVMIAVAIIAISIATLLGSQAQSVSMAEIARFNITASLLAQMKLSELELVDFTALESETGTFDEPYDDFQYELEVRSLAEDDSGIPDSDVVLKSVDLVINTTSETQSPYHVRSIIMDNKVTEGR